MSAEPSHLDVPDLTTPWAQTLLAIADDALLTGHRASHWTGVAPTLEEDLAFSTIAQDAITQADLWYQLLLTSAGWTGDVRAGADALGLGRDPGDYRHAVVCERPPRDFAFTLARHWVTVHAGDARHAALERSSDPEVRSLALTLRREARYHAEHADHWFHRLAHHDQDTNDRLRAALADVLPEALGLFEPVVGEQEVVDTGRFPRGHERLREDWLAGATPVLDGAGYGDLVPADDAEAPPDARGGRVGRHSDDFVVDVWPEMTALYRADPTARW